MSELPQFGPGVRIFSQADEGGLWIARLAPGLPIDEVTAEQIAAQPIHHQWASRTNNGLIASWPSVDFLTYSAQQGHAPFLPIQFMPMDLARLSSFERVVVLVDQDGVPLPAGDGPQ